MNSDFHVAIVGAGIGGLALAMALHKKSVPFTLYEDAKEFSAVGAGIGFAPNGMRAMDLIEPGFRPLYERICVGNKGADKQDIFFEGMLLSEGLGKDQAWYGKSAWGHPDFERKSAHRKALLDIMTSFIPRHNVKFNKRLVNIEQLPSKLVLTFADGEVEEASILAGADGIKSTVREHVLKPQFADQVAPVYADAYCYRAVIPMADAEAILGDLTDVAKFYFGHKRCAVTYRISEGKEFNYLLCVTDEQGWKPDKAVTQKVLHEAMMTDFEGPGVDDRFRQLLAKASPIRWGFFHHLRTSTYYRDRVALLGDSAHASLPFQAAGAAQGVEDALVLSNILSELVKSSKQEANSDANIVAGLSAYDSVRRPRAQKQLEQSAEVAQSTLKVHLLFLITRSIRLQAPEFTAGILLQLKPTLAILGHSTALYSMPDTSAPSRLTQLPLGDEAPRYSTSELYSYFQRIRLPQKYLDTPLLSDNTLATTKQHGLPFLQALTIHHTSHIPFENLELHYSTHKTITLNPQALYTKIVTQRRGGRCMENNTFFGTVLRSLGFHVRNCGGRVSRAMSPYAEWDLMMGAGLRDHVLVYVYESEFFLYEICH
ncbi:uncharacterized protein J4E84_010381 [Alternaria hordeiaustralica]|uniref:uncharacterized protein n=1 Tax=Alternaria hordeiaustralica TaxID=1187925 RepID=UPI0020C26A60|nr:uncharacterized protein J4E84_010381 [Alternaria hordeiaustralica]KAI4674775.1 hypothetical protein J4E84_010381 [Alternaria hordeiaustralica]